MKLTIAYGVKLSTPTPTFPDQLIFGKGKGAITLHLVTHLVKEDTYLLVKETMFVVPEISPGVMFAQDHSLPEVNELEDMYLTQFGTPGHLYFVEQ